jgi:hypothetical protein
MKKRIEMRQRPLRAERIAPLRDNIPRKLAKKINEVRKAMNVRGHNTLPFRKIESKLLSLTREEMEKHRGLILDTLTFCNLVSGCAPLQQEDKDELEVHFKELVARLRDVLIQKKAPQSVELSKV